MIKHLIILVFSISITFNINCSSSDCTENKNSANNSIPPGTVDIKGEVIEYFKENEEYICRLKIIEVLAYGASTPILPPGTEKEMYINQNLLQKMSNSLKKGEILLARISYLAAPGDTEYWRILFFNNK